jgi:FkbM family methyltransferase
MLLAFLRPGDTVIDVGAHVGTLAVPLAAKVGAGGRVVAVEASEAACELLADNVRRNGLEDRVTLHRALVTDRPGPYVSADVEGNTGARHFAPVSSGEAIPCVAVDELAGPLPSDRPLRLLKIDVEGMEVAVLRSARRTLETRRPLVYVEVWREQLVRSEASPAALESLLRAERYALFRNVGERNSSNDLFALKRLASLHEGGEFFDCLAIPEEQLWTRPVTP